MVNGWVEVELLSLSDGGMQNGVFYEVSRKGRGIPLINVGDLYSAVPINNNNLELFDANDEEINRFAINDGDLFFTRSSVVPGGIAQCNWYKKIQDKKPVVFDSHVIRFKTDKTKVIPMYLYLQCISAKARSFFVANAKTATMTTIDQEILGKCPIPIPPLPEQRRIAAVLSDTDELIATLEKLIAKKRAIKQGTMQELLTGKRRLPGFSGEWVETTLGEICEIKDGTHQTPKYEDYGIPFYSVENITNNNFTNTKYISLNEHLRLTANYKIERGDILMTRIGSIGVCKYVDWNVNSSFYVSLALLKCKNVVNARFLNLYSQSEQFKKEIDLHSLQHAIPKKINLGNIALVRLPLPNLSEQTAIASILSDMDAEIDTLTAKLNKLRNIKQGMMSELLTGRIRLPMEGNHK